jgi:hypothetical protein
VATATMARTIGEAVGGGTRPLWLLDERSPLQEQVDVVQNKLATVIANAEVALQLVDGPARARLERLLGAAWQASTLVAGLPSHALS